jgi:acetyl-CoA C-acetyltransferase
MTACIVGWAHTPFGKLAGETVESLIVRVAGDALADAAVAAKDVDEIVLGHFNAGFSAQDFTASLVLQASPDLRFKRATRVENACATGSAAVHQGLKSIAARSARIVLVVGVEQMTTTPAAEVGRNLLKASYVREEADIDGGFAGIFGKIAGLYFQRWGDQSDALARIAAKNHKNGVAILTRRSARISATTSAAPRARRIRCVAGTAQAHRLLARLRRRRRDGARRRRDRAQAQ